MQSQEVLANKKGVLLEVDGFIGPAKQEYIHKGIAHAVSEQAEFVILRLNTPGGFDTAMREIIKDILASPLPIVTYVAPQGARAASAGTYIVYASPVAAMAPATHLGAATPVGFDMFGSKDLPKENSAEQRKILSDSIAYIKELAELHHRNGDWAAKAVKDAVSIGSEEALHLGVIDIVASDIPDLLKQLEGRSVQTQTQIKVFKTEGAQIETWEPDWRTQFLEVITDPSIAYILLIIGIWGIFFEFVNPGFILPGVAGTIALLLALYAFQLLPIHYTGLALTIAGILFIVSELYIPSYGTLGGGGLIAFVVGSVFLFDLEGYPTPWGLIIGMTLATVIFLLIIIGVALKARRKKVVSGLETMVGTIAVVQDDFKDQGWVKVGGVFWQAHSSVPLKKGQHVKIIQCEGLTLTVGPTSQKGDKHD